MKYGIKPRTSGKLDSKTNEVRHQFMLVVGTSAIGRKYLTIDICESLKRWDSTQEVFAYHDNSKSIYSGKTTTNTGNAVGRAIVGGALFGGVGAIIGGVTANQTEYGTTTIQHAYSIVISVDSISTPNITINLKSNQTATNELASLLSVIVNRNNLSN